jgi:hypothetical protein
MITTFKLNEDYKIDCESKGTRNGFKHVAKLILNGVTIDETKICYLNRTWERYQFESVFNKMMDRHQELKRKLDVLNALKQ